MICFLCRISGKIQPLSRMHLAVKSGQFKFVNTRTITMSADWRKSVHLADLRWRVVDNVLQRNSRSERLLWISTSRAVQPKQCSSFLNRQVRWAYGANQPCLRNRLERDEMSWKLWAWSWKIPVPVIVVNVLSVHIKRPTREAASW